MKNQEVVYVQIDIDVCLGVWKPVWADSLGNGVYQLTEFEAIWNDGAWTRPKEPNYDPEFEEWEFTPGTVVVCRLNVNEKGELHRRAMSRM